ncbi:helix-turn-helix domain-containing protein [Lysobacter panacisoli]|uniref:HTH araC/xylS-type domain-containing protein n=1 Tax=Lysobacter panacisoli TaxID=1255263 RepID=A0ABP9L163_9GAMM|nr:AraC family transcriptional regulator [Lysobacter panacisoli]
MSLHRPVAALRPFVEALWASDGAPSPATREHVLPCGTMHLAIRLDATSLRLYRNDDDAIGERLAAAVVAGARTRFYTKLAQPTASVGVMLRAGAARALLGCDADVLAGRHVALCDIWSAGEVERLQERLSEAADASARIDVLQSALLARLRPIHAMHPAIAQALQSLGEGEAVRTAVAVSGCSHRHFIARFRAATGLAPKEYARVRRLRRALRGLSQGHALGDVALDAGYADQAHLQREFRAMCGMTPREYRRAGARAQVHVAAVNFVQDRSGAPA